MCPRRRPVRVLHILPDLAAAGGQHVVLGLVRGLDRGRYPPSVLALRPPEDLRDALVDAGADLTVGSAAPIPVQALRAARLVLHERIGLLHVHSDRDREVGQLAALATGRPVVGHLHAPWDHLAPFCAPGSGRAARARAAAKARLRSAVERRAVRGYVAAGDLVADFHRNRVPAAIRVVPNGVDLCRFAPVVPAAHAAVRSSLGLPAGRPVVTTVGRVSEGKGHADVVRAVAVCASRPLVLVVGDGPLRAAVEDLARGLGVDEQVRFVGEQRDVVPFLHAADAFVLASRTEGYPVAVLEAMACGLPVLAYDIPGVRAAVGDSAGALLAAARDIRGLARSIDRLLTAPAERSARGRAARRRAEARFDVTEMVRSVEEAYDHILGFSLQSPRRADRDHDLLPA